MPHAITLDHDIIGIVEQQGIKANGQGDPSCLPVFFHSIQIRDVLLGLLVVEDGLTVGEVGAVVCQGLGAGGGRGGLGNLVGQGFYRLLLGH